MNNLNYIGSSVFIINMDFNFKYVKEKEENKLNEILKLAGGKGANIKKAMESRDLILPPIK
jgi:fructose-1-phosphate kinase PfkB-like protein